MNSRTIRLTEDTYALLKRLAEPLEDTPETVIRRLAEMALAAIEYDETQAADVQPHPVVESQEYVNITIGGPLKYEQKYALIPINRSNRRFFPGYKTPFILETVIGDIITQVTSSDEGTPVGDPTSGKYIMGNLRPWYENQAPELQHGGTLRIACVEPKTRYRLSLITD
ncbi:MAG: hypothetical protein ACOYEQ_02825 [Bacillota bacterium]|jgi:hypothetical protein